MARRQAPKGRFDKSINDGLFLMTRIKLRCSKSRAKWCSAICKREKLNQVTDVQVTDEGKVDIYYYFCFQVYRSEDLYVEYASAINMQTWIKNLYMMLHNVLYAFFILDDGRLTAQLQFIVCESPLNHVVTNLITVEKEICFLNEKDGADICSRHKPTELYEVLINLFTRDKTLHIIYACCGADSCAVSCSRWAHSTTCGHCVITQTCKNCIDFLVSIIRLVKRPWTTTGRFSLSGG